jgi:hypothetical protein
VVFLKNLRTRVGNYLLGKEVTKARQARTILSMKEAKTIGLVFSSSNEEDVEIAGKYENYLKEMGKTVKTIGFIGAKDTAANVTWWTGPQYITRKELSWFYKPSEEFIGNFVKEQFDMLIDMNIGGELPLMFVSASSKAKCKVGRYDEKYLSIYDVMIETDKTKTLKYFLRNVDTYMDMLDKGNLENATK